jgi:hypothetical protein
MPEAPMSEAIKKLVEAAIGQQGERDYSLNPTTHAALTKKNFEAERLKAPDDADVKRVGVAVDAFVGILNTEAVTKAMTLYDKHDGESKRLRDTYLRWATAAIWLSIAAIVICAFTTITSLDLSSQATVWIAVVAFALLLVSWMLMVWLNVYRPQERWRERRGNAEFFRKALFEIVLDQKADSADQGILAALKAEYFRRYQYQVQRAYFSRRSGEHRRKALRYDVARHTVSVVPIFVLLASLGVAVVMWGEQAFTGGAINYWAGKLWLAEQLQLDTMSIFAALVAGALSAGLFAISTLDNNRTNSVRYANMLKRFETMYGEAGVGYSSVLKAALEANDAPLRDFVRRIHELMSAELQEWTRLNPKEMEQIGRTETGAIVPSGSVAQANS